MGDNNLLMAVALLERTKALLKMDKREQLNRVNVLAIKQSLEQVIARLNQAGINDVYVLGQLVDVVETIGVRTEDAGFIETDTETKDVLTKKITDSLGELYILSGKYYNTIAFDYSVRLEPLLCRIVDACVERGYYFGVEVK